MRINALAIIYVTMYLSFCAILTRFCEHALMVKLSTGVSKWKSDGKGKVSPEISTPYLSGKLI